LSRYRKNGGNEDEPKNGGNEDEPKNGGNDDEPKNGRLTHPCN
jgi:hypothetical protein